MKKILIYLFLALVYTTVQGQDYVFTNTGNLHTTPYGIKTWDWDTAAYKKFSYTSTTGGDNYTMPYRLLSPPNNDATKKYPLFIMFHGAGEGIGGDCDNSTPPNTCQLTWGGQISLDSINKYPSYVFFPQTGGGYWGNNGIGNAFYGFSDPMPSPTRTCFEIIENILLKNYNIDPDRIYISGLSAGARAVWEFLLRRPDLFAAATPLQGMGNTYLAKTVINNPIWNYQGGQDDNPAPWETENMYDSLVKYGGSPKRSLYVDRDHWVWVDAYQSKTWMQWIYAQNKKNIHILYGKSPTICTDSTLQLGFSYGFLQYQWKKDGVNIAGGNAYVQTINQPGTYSVDYQRVNGAWASSNPIVIASKFCGTTADNGIKYSYYEGTWTSIPNFNTLIPIKSGTLANFSLTPRNRDLNYAMKFDGFLDIPTAGTYTFYTTSDDGSMLYINGKQVVFNDYAQGPTERSGTINLTAGKQAISVTYLQQVGGQTLEVRYSGPGIVKQLIADYSLYINPPAGWTNLAPVAYAGKDSTLLLPNNSITINGNGIDGDGSVTGYSWTKLSGPSATLSGVNTASLMLSNLSVGAYAMKLTVVDNSGATGIDTVVVTVLSPTNGISYAYYQGNYNNLPNFTTQTIVKSGTVSNFTLAPRTRDTQYAFKFDGYIDIQTAGSYTFFTNSDDGSALFVDGVQVVNNNFLQGPTERSGTANLAVGKRALSVQYFQQGGGQLLEVRYQGPGITKQLIPNYAIYYTLSGVNQNPVANAGPDQVITLPVSSKIFTGTGTDSDGTIASYAWSQVSGPNTATLAGATTTSLTASGLIAGSYTFRLTVKDNLGATGTDDVVLTVNSATNQPPVANAGPDQAISLPVSSKVFTGTGTDSDGTIASYTWSQVSGPNTATLAGATTTSLTASGLIAGSYTFRLTVKDNLGATGTDDVVLTVNSATNQPPVANAGPDQAITLPVSSKVFTGSGTDSDGTIASYTWSQVSGPNTATLAGATSTSLTASGLIAGSYTFRLTVKDNLGATGTDDVVLTVNSATNQPPVANAGPDQAITLPVSSKVFTGSGTDSDGTIASYAWSQVSGPNTATLAGATTTSCTAGGLIAGSYTFRLTVKDNLGATGTDDVVLTVNAANIPPAANAGPDLSITLPTNTVTFSGAGTDADGTVTGFNWVQLSGPSVATLTGATTASLTASNLVAGNYSFKLTVTDNNSAIGSDSVLLLVNQASTGNSGITYSYYEGYFTNLPDFNTLTPKKTGTTTNYSLTPRDQDIQYAFKYDGYINIQTAGLYTFFTTSDDGSALYIDGVQVVNNNFLQGPTERSGTINLAVGKRAITVAFFQLGGGADLEVRYQGPSLTKQLIPDNVLFLNQSGGGNIAPTANAGPDITLTLPTSSATIAGSGNDPDGSIASYAWTQQSGPAATLGGATTSTLSASNLVAGTYIFRLNVIDNKGAGAFDDVTVKVNSPSNGLTYSYYEGYYTNLPAFSSLTPVKTGSVSNFSLAPRNTDIQYAFKYDGYLNIPTSGVYTFYTTSDDGSALFIDGVEIVNNDYLQGPTERSGTVSLSAGRRAIEVTFFQLGGGAALEVRYEGPGITKQLIPDAALYTSQSGARLGDDNVAASGSAFQAISSPNPARDFVVIKFNQQLDEVNYSIIDVLGKTYSEGKASNTSAIEVSLHAHYMPPGIYFVKLSTATGTQLLKINKE